MNAIHYIVAGAQSPLGRAYLQSLHLRGVDVKQVTAMDLKPNKMSYGEDQVIDVVGPQSYKQHPHRANALVVLAEPAPALIDIADSHLDDDRRVLDLTGHFLNDPDAVLFPEQGNLVVQASAAARMLQRVIKALPGKPESVHVTALLPVSHYGKDGMDELFQQSRQFFVAEDLDHSVFPKKIVYNVIPYAGALQDDGLSSEETRIHAEWTHMFPALPLVINTAVVPVFIGISLQIVVRYSSGAPSPHEAMLAWHRDRGLRIIDTDSEMMAASPAEIAGDDMVSVSRVHNPPNMREALSFWAMADNTLF